LTAGDPGNAGSSTGPFPDPPNLIRRQRYGQLLSLGDQPCSRRQRRYHHGKATWNRSPNNKTVTGILGKTVIFWQLSDFTRPLAYTIEVPGVAMGIHNLDRLFRPASIAVIGASQRPNCIGSALMDNLLGGEFQGRLFPINSKHSQIMGLPAAPAIGALDARIDLAVVAVPIDQVPKVIGQCAAAEVKTAIVISAGGKETGAPGRAIEERIRQPRYVLCRGDRFQPLCQHRLDARCRFRRYDRLSR
jgi:hypothetical protein